MKMLFGKYKDKEIAEIPLEYLHWLANNVELKGALKWSICKHLKMNVDDLEQLRNDYNTTLEENKILKKWLNCKNLMASLPRQQRITLILCIENLP